MQSVAVPADDFVGTLRRLRAAQKSSKGAPLYSRYVNRPLGRVFAAAAYRLGLTPNQVTIVSALCTAVGIALICAAPLGAATGIPVMIALCVGYALDSADGQLARLRGGGSTTGEWLDHVIDAAKTSAVHLAVLVAFLRRYPDADWHLLVPIVFTAVAAVHFFGLILKEQLTRIKRLEAGLEGRLPEGATGGLAAAMKLPIDYGFFAVVLGFFSLPSVFLVIYLVMAAANLGYLMLVLPKWYRDMGALDRLGQPQGS